MLIFVIRTYICNDCQLVAVNTELLDAFCASVDQPQTVLLARLELKLGNTSVGGAIDGSVRAWVVHFAVNQIVVGHWRKQTLGSRSHDLLNDIEVARMVPVVQKDGTEINIVGLRFRTINDHRAECSSHILGAVVAVIEGGAVKVRFEAVGESGSVESKI